MTILNTAKALKEILPKTEDVELIHDQVIATHSHALLDNIIMLHHKYTSENERKKALKKLLQENWAFVQGTSLCYTALPNHEITHFMSEIACQIATQENAAFSLLLPGVSTEPSNLVNYSDLEEQCVTATDFKKLFSTHLLSQNGKAFIPVRVLITENFLSSNTLPNIYFDALDSDYENRSIDELETLTKLNDLEIKRLKAHSPLTKELFDAKSAFLALQNDGASLYSQLLHLLDALYTNSSQNNITHEELSGTQIAAEAQRFYQFYRQLSEELRAQIPWRLRYEIEYLEVIFSAQKDFLTEDAFKKMVAFLTSYYEEHKDYLPLKALNNVLMRQRQDYIETKRLEEASKISAIRPIESLDTCFATRFLHIKHEIKGHESVLSNIGLSEKSREVALSRVSNEYNDALKTLQLALSENARKNSYEGFDKLSLTSKIISRIHPILTFRGLDEAISLIAELNEEELPLFFNDPITQKSLLSIIKIPDLLISFLLGLPTHLLRPILKRLDKKAISHELSNHFDEIIVAWGFLSDEKKDCLFDAFDINQVNRDKDSLLMVCIKREIIPLAIDLIKRNTALNIRNKNGKTALDLALLKNQPTLLVTLINQAVINFHQNLASSSYGFTNAINYIEALDPNTYVLTPQKHPHRERLLEALTHFKDIAFLILYLPVAALCDVLNTFSKITFKRIFIEHFQLMIELLNMLDKEKRSALLDFIDVNQQDKDRRTPLMYSIILPDRKNIFNLLLEKTKDINAQSYSGKTALHYAAEYGEIDIIKALMIHGADINIQTVEGATPLCLAIQVSQTEAALTIIHTSSNIDYSDVSFSQLIYLAIEKNLITVAVSLVQKWKNVDTYYLSHQPPLLLDVLYKAQQEIALALINNTDIDIHMSDAEGYNPLFLSIEKGYSDIVLALIKKGVDIQSRNSPFKETPLSWAIKKSQFEIGVTLIERGALLSLTNQEVHALLKEAIQKGHTQLVSSILKNRDVDRMPSVNSQNLLMLAFIKEQPGVAISLVNHGYSLDATDEEGNTPLIYALSSNNLDLAQTLIEKGARLDTPNKQGNYPLHFAIHLGLIDMALAIVEKGVDLNLLDKEGDSALILAIDKKYNTLALRIIEKGGIDDQESPLLLAIQTNNNELALSLLEREALPLDATNDFGDTPLILAISEGLTDVALALIKKGAKLNVVNNEGDTALIYAIDHKKPDIANALIAHGADIHQTDCKGKTPLRLALEMFDTQTAKTLIEKGAKIDSPNQTMNGPLTLQEYLNLTAIRSRLKTVLSSIERNHSLTNDDGIAPSIDDEAVIPTRQRA